MVTSRNRLGLSKKPDIEGKIPISLTAVFDLIEDNDLRN